MVDWLRPKELQITLVLAGLAGFLGALGSLGFQKATEAVHWVFTGSWEAGLSESFAHLPWWQRIVVPTVGGAAAGLVLMKHDPPSVHLDAAFEEICSRFTLLPHNYLYVIDEKGRFCGVIALHDIKRFLSNPDLARLVIARDIMRENFPSLGPDDFLTTVFERFARHEGERYFAGVETTRGEGRPEREIVNAAADWQADVVVLCSRAEYGEKAHIGPRSVGHVARFVLDHAPCPGLARPAVRQRAVSDFSVASFLSRKFENLGRICGHE